jgi:hypothetical protein
MNAMRKAARDLQGSGYFAPDIQQSLVTYTRQPADLIRNSPRYDVFPDLRVDFPTVQDAQREFIDEGALTYKAPINEALLIARF